MEDSLSSYSKGEKDEANDHQEEEESGWTSYFDDFFDSQTRLNHQQTSYLDDQNLGAAGSNSSAISDAASYVEYWKTSNTLFGSSPKFSKKLNFKKTGTKKIPYDDSLEDTASSPVNSPKVGGLKEVDFSRRKSDDNNIESSMGKGGEFDHRLQKQTHGFKDDEMVSRGQVKDDRTTLRKKGMCLVPVSMLVNYLG